MDYARILSIMEEEGRKHNAPIFAKEEVVQGEPFRILVFTMLSARSRDSRTMEVCRSLFREADTPRGILSLGQDKVSEILHPIGFYKGKTKRLLGLCEKLLSDFGGKVPSALEELTTLPGVGRKTANIILARVFGQKTIAVDVHVHRISNRLGWVKTKKPLDTEKRLMKLLPDKAIPQANRAMVSYGQTVCLPRNPKCAECRIREYCQRIGLPKSIGLR
ncbi:endonuclease III [Candidatus Micrarchaeota archaeon]|nr:endonuclease III [Candidatus Micrarchaeota archaeon]